jgi:hypothetical protein
MKIVKITLNEITELIKKSINENYPLGADNDSRAPWNQKDSTEYKGDFDLDPLIHNGIIYDIEIYLYKSGAKAKTYLSNLIEKYDENGEIEEKLFSLMPTIKSFYLNLKKIENIIKPRLSDLDDIEWEEIEPDYPEYEKD